ncbi:MAG: anaerobic sulfite reductase subunit AsrA [Eubacterium sp.]|nr:anaerobic sulfite reductase subunit AsrA [Eubacterium sp.]
MNERRYHFYCFLARCFEREIDKDAADKIKNMNLPKSDGSELIKSGVALDADELAADFANVFLGAGRASGGAAFPYESVYTSEQHLMMQDAWSRVKNFMAQSGHALKTDDKALKEDHIAAELYFMATLVKDDDNMQRGFFESHLEGWTKAFLDDVEKYAKTPFYKGLSILTKDFLDAEKELLDSAVSGAEHKDSFVMSKSEFDGILKSLKKKYKIFAPAEVKGQAKKEVRYKEIDSADEIVLDRPSDYSPKEIFYPIVQTMIYFKGESCEESIFAEDKDYLIIMRACDANAIKRLDKIFLENGGRGDNFYRRRRERVRIMLLECEKSFEQCFCVSMGSEKTKDYDVAIRIKDDAVSVNVKNSAFAGYFANCKEEAYEPVFIKENERKVALPVISSVEELKKASELPYWEKYDDNCIGCGGCNTVCPTCSCFDTVDIRYDEQGKDGERRRVWSSCMLDTFTMTAGGSRARKTAGANMRFKTLHKVYDFSKRFETDYNMCVGCGRCITRCPKDIDFSDTVNGFAKALEDEKGGAK